MRLGVAFVTAVTLWRVILLWFDQTDLFVDEVQYWFWGQNLDFGYYSKPPMIAWIIRAVNELAGSDARFWVRLPAPLFHMATALILMQVADRFYGKETGAWAGPVYIVLPAVAVGSALFSTDTVMLCFYALAMLAYFNLMKASSVAYSLLLGVALGLGLMSKYAMIYFVICSGLSVIFLRETRISFRDALIALSVAAALVAPNMVWNFKNGGTTFKHTAENASWDGFKFDLGTWSEFFFAQFGVFGPILFASFMLIAGLAVARKVSRQQLHLLILSMPILLFMCWQALVSRAYANWAAATYIAATILVTHWLLTHGRRWLIASQALHLFIALLLPLFLLFPSQVILPNGKPLLKRYMNRHVLSHDIASLAKEHQVRAIISSNRDILADLHYSLKGQGFDIFALPAKGFPRHYYQQNFAIPPGFSNAAIFATLRGSAPCDTAKQIATKKIDVGAYTGRSLTVYSLDAKCLAQIAPKPGT